MIVRAVAWDIDGTLIDSEPLHYATLLAVSAMHGANPSHLPDQAFQGIHMNEVWMEVSCWLPRGLPEKVHALRKEGLSCSEIARRTGYGGRSIAKWLTFDTPPDRCRAALNSTSPW